MKFRFKILAIIILAALPACHNPITNPKPLLLDTELDYGPANYRSGYKDGCESALAAYGNSYQKTFYDLSKDPQYERDRMYNQVWKDAWAYCYMWLYVHNRKDNLTGKSLL